MGSIKDEAARRAEREREGRIRLEVQRLALERIKENLRHAELQKLHAEIRRSR